MINLNKNTEAILQSQRDQKIAKERHLQRNKTIIKKSGIGSSRILLISNMLMEEERTWHVGKTNNWDTNFTASSCGMSIHREPHITSQTLKTLDFSGRLKMGVQVKGQSAGKTKYQMNKKREYAPFYRALWSV